MKTLTRVRRLFAPLEILGHLDEFRVDLLRGWVANSRRLNKALELHFYVDDMLVAKIYADKFRKDLLTAGFGNGRHGFEVVLPRRMLVGGRSLKIFARVHAEMVLFKDIVFGGDVVPAPAALKPTVYLDISDLLQYFTYHREVSGIQRVQCGYIYGLVKSNYPRLLSYRDRTDSFGPWADSILSA